MIGTDCTSSCKSNYHTITSTMAQSLMSNPWQWRFTNLRFFQQSTQLILHFFVTSYLKHNTFLWQDILFNISNLLISIQKVTYKMHHKNERKKWKSYVITWIFYINVYSGQISIKGRSQKNMNKRIGYIRLDGEIIYCLIYNTLSTAHKL